jgi:superfamily II DNA or RNA helicase
MSSFSQFLATFDTDPGRRGRQFEHFVKWFLTTDPEWSTQVARVWLWDEWAGRWGRDCGIDLVFEHRNGTTWAVQAKCYAPDYEVTKSDIDKFLSETSRKAIDHRLLIATTDLLGANARKVCDGQEKPVVRYLLSDFEKASVDYPESLVALATGRRKTPPQPRPYQIEAIDNVARGFETADRGQLLMACGTGKTLVSMWIKERLDARRTLVLVPSLGLLSQIVSDWTSAANTPFDVLCVCSDQTVGKRDEDEAVTSVSELPFPVTGDTAEIARFLHGDGHRVVFSTYQSSPLVEAAQADQAVPAFDLILADEAHRCAGKVDGAFATVLDGRKLRGARRLFATATPRTYSSSLKAAAGEIGVEVVGMDDEEVFGRPLHTLSFGEAIERNLLTDYQVVIVGVDDAMIAEWIRNRRIVSNGSGVETDAQALATQIGLIKAIKDYGLKRIISFHSRVKRAAEFAQELPLVLEWLEPQHKPYGTIAADHVSGAMSAIARRQKLSRLKQIGEGEFGILANARCLSEGVDVPALDGVAFVDPRSSQIDIVQAVGRAIRLSKDKMKGTIIIPVFIEQSDDAEQAILSSNFKPIWQILDALKSHDDILSSQLDQFRIELGSGKREDVGASDLNKISFDLPTHVSPTFASLLRTHLVERTTESWMMWYGLLQAFHHQEGHCDVPNKFETAKGLRLGSWVGTQRIERAVMSSERRGLLEAIGFVWDARELHWDKNFEALTEFVKNEGHARVPTTYKNAQGVALGLWAVNLRANRTKLAPERDAQLSALGFDWAPNESLWEAGYEALEKFRITHGHCRVEKNSDTNLHSWVQAQRDNKDSISNARKARLETLGFVWSPREDVWEAMFSALKEYQQEHGHCEVPAKWAGNRKLGVWVGVQRRNVQKLSVERKARLDALGFVWNARAQWDEMFAALIAYKDANNDFDVPRGWAQNPHLGAWVSEQRRSMKFGELSPERKARLQSIGFVEVGRWERMFAALEAYRERFGDCSVPPRWIENPKLATWVEQQRRAHREGRLLNDRQAQLDRLEFVWNPDGAAWEEMFEALKKYKSEYGNCNVPIDWPENPALGVWVKTRRRAQEKMPSERRARLDAIGFVWSLRSKSPD